MRVEASIVVVIHGSYNTKSKVCVAVAEVAQAFGNPAWNPFITIVYEPGGYVAISVV